MDTGAVNAGVDFRIGTFPPQDTKTGISELYLAMWQVIRTLVLKCGISQQVASKWNILNNSTSTLNSGNLNRFYTTAAETIAYGALVSLQNVGGVLVVKNANATDNTKPCDGFCSTLAGIPSGTVGEVILKSGLLNTSVILVPGTRYYLSSATPGGLTTVAPVASGNIEQYVGIAINSSQLLFGTHYWVQH